MSLVECVPNVSEGRDADKIALMANAITHVSNVTLLHADSNSDANRTVFTFAGALDDVCNAAYRLFQTATSIIDMRTHHGEHIRNGVVDVCPLIPIRDVTTSQCIEAATELGERIGVEGTPVYLYAMAATHPNRESLAYLRKGQYEALHRKLRSSTWTPDFGPTAWDDHVAKTGSIQIGVRPFLIALNVNLKTQEVIIAKKIARAIRTSGFNGQSGEFMELKADGWWMKSYNCAQVTMNFTNYRVTPPHRVLRRISELAQCFGTETSGSELIGLIPEEALVMAGREIVANKKEKPSTEKIIEYGIKKLGLNSLRDFSPAERVFEYRLEQMSHQKIF